MSFEPKKKLRIIVLVHEDLVPPDSLAGLSSKDAQEVKTEYDVISTLKGMGHEVHAVGLYSQLNPIGNALLEQSEQGGVYRFVSGTGRHHRMGDREKFYMSQAQQLLQLGDAGLGGFGAGE